MTEPIAIAPGASALAPLKGERRRIGGLDVLRGLAAMAVLVYHYAYNYERLFHDRTPNSPIKYGALGVQLFFIISGFVIFMTLEKTRRPIDFVRSRFSRLYPAYWAAVILTFLVLRLFPLPPIAGDIHNHKYHPTLIRGVLNLTMCQEMAGVGHVDPVYWTLQLELCFYLLMFLLFLMKQVARAEFYLLGFLALSQFLCWLFPAGAQHGHLVSILISDVKLLTVTSLDPPAHPNPRLQFFIIGIMLYKLVTQFRPRHLVVLAVCLVYDGFREFGANGIDFYFTLAFTAIVYAAARGWLWPLENRATLFLGAISYSLYLTHQNIGYELIHAMGTRGIPTLVALIIAGVAAIGIAAAITYAIEQPALRLLRGAKPPRRPTEIPLTLTSPQICK